MIISYILVLVAVVAGPVVAADKVPMNGSAKCQEAIGTDGAYTFDSCKPQPGGFCHCYSKPKEGKGDPVYVTVIHPDAGAPEEPAAVAEDLPRENQRKKRFKMGHEEEQAKGVEKFSSKSKTEREKLRKQEGGDWEDGKLPKQHKIFNTDKSLRRKPSSGE